MAGAAPSGAPSVRGTDPVPSAPDVPTASSARVPFTLPQGPRDDNPLAPLPPPLYLAAWRDASRAKNIPAAPPKCTSFVARAAAVPPAVDVASALTSTDPARRDALLVGLGDVVAEEKRLWVHALRADLAPVECADVIIDPILGRRPVIETPVSNVLVGLSLAAKLSRTVIVPPSMWGVRGKGEGRRFPRGPARGVVCERDGDARHPRFGYERPDELRPRDRADGAGDRRAPSRRSASRRAHGDGARDLGRRAEGSLRGQLEPAVETTKLHGRDAVLAGLADFAQVGVLEDARVARARTTLARVFPDRRIDALDGLMLPPRVAPAPSTPLGVASRSVPTYWLGFLGADPDGLDVLVRGVPQPTRAHHRRSNDLADVAANEAYARTRFEMGAHLLEAHRFRRGGLRGVRRPLPGGSPPPRAHARARRRTGRRRCDDDGALELGARRAAHREPRCRREREGTVGRHGRIRCCSPAVARGAGRSSGGSAPAGRGGPIPCRRSAPHHRTGQATRPPTAPPRWTPVRLTFNKYSLIGFPCVENRSATG